VSDTDKLLSDRAFLILIVLLTAGAVAMGVNTGQTIARNTAERHGTITVSSCVLDKYGAHGDIYRCFGDFTADGGSFQVQGVEFSNAGRLPAGARVDGLVSGPGDHTANAESNWQIGVKSAITLALVAAVAGLAVLWRRVRAIRRRATGSGAERG
jgi:hypothetical protein